jgi:dienelactone hydrolase
MKPTLVGLLLLATSPLAAQQPTTDAGVIRLYGGKNEVARESYRLTAAGLDQNIVVPVATLRIESHSEFSPDGHFLGYRSRGFDLSTDSMRYAVEVARNGDSVRARITAGSKVDSAAIAGVPDLGLPNQSIYTFMELIRRAARRDTTFHLYVTGSPTLVPVKVSFLADSATASVGPIQLKAQLNPDGSVRSMDIPQQGVHAERWNGDSLPPLQGQTRPKPDYTAPPGSPYTTEELRIPIHGAEGDTFSLAGTLTRPVMNRLVPVVVMISGSGSQPRDEELWPLVQGYRPFRQIADELARAGIASFRYDDRGVDASGGSPALATTADLANDVKQILAFLRTRPDLDPNRVAILGHSEGGAIGPMVASEDRRLAALVIMAGPGKTGLAILRDQFRYPIESAASLSARERDSQLALVEHAVQSWTESSPWTRWFATYDPMVFAGKVRQPVLILQGALDRQVFASQADTLAAALRKAGNRDVTLHVYPGLNHLFLPTPGTGSPMEYATLPDVAIPASVLGDIAQWLKTHLTR